MAWIYLLIAGLFEIGWAIGMKYTEGFHKILPTVLVFIAMVLSVYFLSVAVKTIPVGTAYAVKKRRVLYYFFISLGYKQLK
ncbi:MAG: DMT family transporter [Bacteroidales bacterium]